MPTSPQQPEIPGLPADTDVTDIVFALSRPHGTVLAHGVRERFVGARVAAESLRTGSFRTATARPLVGAIPFDLDEPAALVVPDTLIRLAQPIDGAPAVAHTAVASMPDPEPDVHRARVAAALEAIAAGTLSKVVLARAVDLHLEPTADPWRTFSALAQSNSSRNAFAVDVGAADESGDWLLGASPEVLVRRVGSRVSCHPYAGSAPRSNDPAADAAARESLRASAKDRREHAFVVDHLQERLSTICDDMTIDLRPQLVATGEMWHLATRIEATLRDPAVNSLELALLLGPTPAVCGTPDDAAAQFIRENEGARGLYAGAVGWCDESGDGEWMVSIRCLRLFADRHRVRTWAGSGIVDGSDPQTEVDETTAKLRTALTALGIERGGSDTPRGDAPGMNP